MSGRRPETRWFNKSAAFDGALGMRFGALLGPARAGAFDYWADTPEGALGLIILLDQVSRNIYRGNPLSFAADGRALRLAMPSPEAITGRCQHRGRCGSSCRSNIPKISMINGAASRCFQTLGLHEMMYWAKVHLEIIARFGRFPHRNAILGRTSTPGEIAFLKAGGFSG
ncbi:MAG: DUF924 domain-containing protein [Sphingomonadales bacterium]|nr:DUF924 domain-containing protein [Sphingomonadales bacterium]